MTKSLKVFLVFIFLLFTARSMAQVQPVRDESMITELKSTEPATDKAIAKADKNDDKQNKDKDKKNGSVKQVKSARPDMSKSRGARPPDIVRPSGSRIPKGVGRPAGAGRHGRG